MYYILLIIGFILLVKCANVFVDGSVGIAERFNIPAFIIGLTIVAMGTSAPEAAVSVTAALTGQNEIATANVVGSNIFNILVVLGVCAIIKPIPIEPLLLKRDFSMTILATLIMLFFSLDYVFPGTFGNDLSRIDGTILLVLFVGYLLIITLPESKKNKLSPYVEAYVDETEEFIEEETQKDIVENNVPSVTVSCLKIVIGLAGIILGGKFVVASASDIATSFGVSSNLIGLTIVAIGTSLPELITSIVASSKGESGLAIGNVLGSNMFNILFVLALSCTIHPIGIINDSIVDMIILLIITVVSMFFFWTKRTLSRLEGSIMIILYIMYTIFIISR